MVCRGCCCGTDLKVPGRDHEADLRALHQRLDGLATIRTSDCMGPCEDASVIVVIPTRMQRLTGAKTVWFRRTNDDRKLAGVVNYITGLSRR